MLVFRALVVSGVRRCRMDPIDHHASYDHLPNTHVCPCAAVNNHSVTRILKDQKNGIADIGFVVSRGVFDYFSKPEFDALPTLLQGHFLQWSNRESNVCRMHFNVDGEYENLALATVLRPECNFQFRREER